MIWLMGVLVWLAGSVGFVVGVLWHASRGPRGPEPPVLSTPFMRSRLPQLHDVRRN